MRSVELQSYLAARTQTDVVTYLVAVTGAEQAILGAVGAVQGAVAAQQAVEAASRASVASAPPPASVPSQSSVGGHSDAWWHGVTICEQGGRDNPTYGYFSIMDGSAAGLSWSAQEAIANSIIVRAGDGAWAASCVAAGYAASPSG